MAVVCESSPHCLSPICQVAWNYHQQGASNSVENGRISPKVELDLRVFLYNIHIKFHSKILKHKQKKSGKLFHYKGQVTPSKMREFRRKSNLICKSSHIRYSPSFIQKCWRITKKSPENWFVTDRTTEWQKDRRTDRG